jgi:DnaJ-class molecular chaperone
MAPVATCPMCNGSGRSNVRVNGELQPCSWCEGRGVVNGDLHQVEVR